MDLLKRKLSELTSHTINIKPKLKMMAVSAFALTALTFGADASAASNSKLKTVYYVYLNNEYVGTVSSKKVVEQLLDEKLEEMKSVYTNVDLDLSSSLTYVPEQVFGTKKALNDEEVVNKISDHLSVQANSTALLIDGQPAVYLKNSDEANQVVKGLKLKYVTEPQLLDLEARQANPAAVVAPLAENETRILDVTLSKEVVQQTEKTTPDKLLTVEQAIEYLTKGTLEQQMYHVKEGDVLGSIAVAHGMEIAQLLALNPGMTEETVLKIDQELNVTVLKPLVEVVVIKEEAKKETLPFANEVVEDANMYKGDTKVQQEGKEGLRDVTYKVSEVNGLRVSTEVTSETILQAPVNHIVVKGTKVVPSRGDGSLAWPTNGGYVSSQQGVRWEKMHKGIDIARPSNRTIKAADNGTIVYAGYDGGYGNKIIIDHNNGMRTVYAHLDSIGVGVGQTVIKGASIGVMGSTGNSTGVHLHFEVYKNGALQNPLTYLK